jgi:hypothetical protein
MNSHHVKMIAAFESQDADAVCDIIHEHFGLSHTETQTSINRSRLLKRSEVGLFKDGQLYSWNYDGFSHLELEPNPEDDTDMARCVLLIKEIA